MRTCLVPCAILWMLGAGGQAAAGGINLTWSDCYQNGGTYNRSFACNTNTGSDVLVATFSPHESMSSVTGGTARIEIATGVSAASWWALSAGGCRSGALQLVLNTPDPYCPDPWLGAAAGSLVYEFGIGGDPTRAGITVSWTLPEGMETTVEPGYEYAAFRLILDHSGAVGDGACAGCTAPACIGLTQICLHQTAGLGGAGLFEPWGFNFAGWQGGDVGPGCPGTGGLPFPGPQGCGVTPTINRTWGQIKTLYR